jgi:hypothetical protein
LSKYSYHFDYDKDISIREIELRKIQAARRIAQVIYKLGSAQLFDSEEAALNHDEKLRNMVKDCLESLKEGIPWPHPYAKHILLDKPEMKYAIVVRKYCELCDFVLIDFLCSGISDTSHFACVILAGESNLKYRCLGIPVEQWHEYKKLPHYKGE